MYICGPPTRQPAAKKKMVTTLSMPTVAADKVPAWKIRRCFGYLVAVRFVR